METKTEPVELKYEIGEEIGKGKFATVKRCRERQTGCEYAAKFIRKNRGTGRRGAKMENIEKEIQILRETNHRNIINLYEVYDTKREVILILELVDGGELFEYLSEKDKLSEEEASSFVRQILDGLEHLHARDIAHLDLKVTRTAVLTRFIKTFKPENILLQDKNSTSVKLIDFGLSRKILPKEDHRAIMGTAEFCAPEVISFEPLSVSTDMWSIGVITYILLSGLSPFLGDNQQDTYHNITSINFEFDEEYFNGTSELAKDFIKKLLVKDTRKRATIYDCLNHPWIQPVEKRDKVLRRSSVINTEHLKKFMARQRWRRSMKVVSLCNRLSRSMQLRRIQSTDTLGSASEEDPDDITESLKQEDVVEDNSHEDKNSCEDSPADVSDVAEQLSQDGEVKIMKIPVSPILDTTKTAASEMAEISGQYTVGERYSSTAEGYPLESENVNSIGDVWFKSLEKEMDNFLTENIEPVARETATKQEMSIENDTIIRRLSGDAETCSATASIVFEKTSDGSFVETAREGQPSTAELSALEPANVNRIEDVCFEILEKDVDTNPTENIEPVAKETLSGQEMSVEKDTLVRRLSDDAETCNATALTELNEPSYEGIVENAATLNLNKNGLTDKNAIESAASEQQETVRTDIVETTEISAIESSEILDLKIDASPVETDTTFDSCFAETSDFFDASISECTLNTCINDYEELSMANDYPNIQKSETVRRVTAKNFEVTETGHDSETTGNVETSYTESANENPTNKTVLQHLEVLENTEILENEEVGTEQLAMDFQTKPKVDHTQLECNTAVGEFDNDIGQYIKITDYESETDHVAIVSFSLDQDDGNFDHQSLCDEKMAYRDLPHRMADTNLDIIAQELVAKIIGQSLELVLNEASSKKKALTAGFSLHTPEDSNEQEADVMAMQTIPEHKVNLTTQLPEPKIHVKKYDPLHLACFEVEAAEETGIVITSHRNGLSNKEEENDEDDLFKPICTSKFILSVRKTAVAGRRFKPELRLRKKATFWEMEDCCETKKYEMFEMQVLNNSE